MRNFAVFTITIFLLTALKINAQENQFKFAETGSSANISFMFTDSLGNTYMAGQYYTSFSFQEKEVTASATQENNPAFVMKVLPNGKVSYLHAIKGLTEMYNVNLMGAAFNQKGEFAVLFELSGMSQFTIADRTIPAKSDDNNVMLAKFSKSGFLMWVRRIDVNGTKAGLGAKCLRIDEAGNVIILGHFTGEKAVFGSLEINGLEDDYRMFLVKYSSDGNPLWASGPEPLSDTSGSSFGYSLEPGNDNEIWVMGTLDGNRKFQFGDSVFSNSGLLNTFIAKYNGSGQVEWANRFKGPGTIIPESMVIDKEGKPTFAVFFNSSSMNVNETNYANAGSYNLLISKYAKNGTSIWDYQLFTYLPAVYDHNSEAKLLATDSLDVTLIGNYIQSGVNHFYAIQFLNLTKAYKWLSFTTNASDIYYANAASDNNGNIYVTGSTSTSFSLGTSVITDINGLGINYLLKIDNTGKVDYFKTQQNDNENTIWFNQLGVDYYGNSYLAGTFYGTDTRLDNISLNEKFTEGIFLAKLTNFATISGKAINYNGDAISEGFVKLLGYATYQKCVIADSSGLNADGTFTFNDVPYGKYLLKYVPLNTDENYLQTYYPSAGYWKDADVVIAMKPEIDSLEIFVTTKSSSTGRGRLSGKVNEIESDDIFKSVQNKPKSSTKAALAVKKTKSDYIIVRVTETDENGDFFFDNVAPGEYYIIIDEAGLPVVSMHMVIISGGSYYTGIDYLISEETIEATGSPLGNKLPDTKDNVYEFSVFPNPSLNGLVNLEISDGSLYSFAEIATIDGRTIRRMEFKEPGIKTLQLDPGFYLIRFSGKNESRTIKLSVK